MAAIIRPQTLLFLLVLNMGAAGQQSRLLSEGKKFLPTPTEAGFIVNAVNVYVQVSQFVRATNELIRSIQTAGESFKEFAQQARTVYEGVRQLKNIDPYNMGTWNMHISQAQWALSMEMTRAKLAFDIFDYKVTGVPVDYLKTITTLDEYRLALDDAGSFVREIYLKREAPRNSVIEHNYTQTLVRTRVALEGLENECRQTECSDEKQRRIQELRSQKNTLENILLGAELSGNKEDSLMQHAQDVIAINVTELKAKRGKMQQLEELAAELVAYYNTLRSGKADATPQEVIEPVVDHLAIEGYDAEDPDQVPLPPPPTGEAEMELDDDVNHGDVLVLQNQIEFVLLQQESLARDMQVMTLNTIATITAMEAFKRLKVSEQRILQAVDAHRFANAN